MSESKVEIPADARQIPYEAFAREPSPTAASRHNRLYGKSGALDYRVTLGLQGGGLTSTVVNAETGDDAAEKALAKFPGWKCVNVTPATDVGLATIDADSLGAA